MQEDEGRRLVHRHFHLNDTPDLDIQKYLASSQHNALLPMFDGLVEKDWTADADYPPIIPGLAASWSVSPDRPRA